MARTWQQLRSVVNGFSTPLFGLSWNSAPETDETHIRRLMNYLEDRRALYYVCELEMPERVTDSILATREELTRALQQLDPNSPSVACIREMRSACRRFLTVTDQMDDRPRYWPDGPAFWMALGELRSIFGINIARLCGMYKIDVEGDISTIIPDDDGLSDVGSAAGHRRR